MNAHLPEGSSRKGGFQRTGDVQYPWGETTKKHFGNDIRGARRDLKHTAQSRTRILLPTTGDVSPKNVLR